MTSALVRGDGWQEGKHNEEKHKEEKHKEGKHEEEKHKEENHKEEKHKEETHSGGTHGPSRTLNVVLLNSSKFTRSVVDECIHKLG